MHCHQMMDALEGMEAIFRVAPEMVQKQTANFSQHCRYFDITRGNELEFDKARHLSTQMQDFGFIKISTYILSYCLPNFDKEHFIISAYLL